MTLNQVVIVDVFLATILKISVFSFQIIELWLSHDQVHVRSELPVQIYRTQSAVRLWGFVVCECVVCKCQAPKARLSPCDTFTNKRLEIGLTAGLNRIGEKKSIHPSPNSQLWFKTKRTSARVCAGNGKRRKKTNKSETAQTKLCGGSGAWHHQALLLPYLSAPDLRDPPDLSAPLMPHCGTNTDVLDALLVGLCGGTGAGKK